MDAIAFAEGLVRELRARRAEAFELHRRHVNPCFVELLELAGYGRAFVRAEACELEDERGERYLDFVGGYGALNLGHHHPAVAAAIRAVLDERVPSFTQVDLSALEGLAAEKLLAALPSGFGRAFFCNSGAEAVEAALKLARAATGRRRFVCCEGAYHGLTLGTLGLNGNSALRRRFEPLPVEVERVPFGDLGALDRALTRDVAAFVVEPVLGEGGVVVPDAGYLPGALALCRRRGALLVADEVQTGLGRTGRMLACEHWGVVPDVVTLAKSLGGGLVPVGALVAREEAFERAYGTTATCQDHNTTFGGGPLAMAAVIATLQVIKEERLCERAQVEGAWLERSLRELAARHGIVREVRGLGLLLGLELQDAARGLLRRTPLRRLGEASAYLVAQSLALRLMAEHRVVAQTAVNAQGVLKVSPPLVVAREQCERFLAALDAALAKAGPVASTAHLAGEAARRRVSQP